MQGFRVEGIILKRKNFGEADRILTVFTHQRGKISVIAKGVRRITSRRAGNVELLNRVLMFLHQTKGMPILTEAKSINTYPKLKEDLTLSTYTFHIIELVDKLTAENQDSPLLYEMLVEVLNKLSKNPRQIFIRAFELKILSLLGFIDFSSDKYISTLGLSKESKEILQNLQAYSWQEVEALEINQIVAMELERVLRYHLERVIEGSLKSRNFLKDLKTNG